MNKELIYAKSKYVRVAPQKVRLIADMVRGKNALYAAEMLQFVNKRAALPMRKTIESAIANAENNDNLDKKELIIAEARVDEAPMFKRGRAVSKGRYHQILKRNSHIVIGLSAGEAGKVKVAKKATAKKAEEVKTDDKKETDAKEVVVEKKEAAFKKDTKNAAKMNQKMLKSRQVVSKQAPRIVQARGK